MEKKKILIWGEAGVGKTTFCRKFCQDWALVVNEKEGKGQELTEEQKSELEKLTEEQRSKLNNIGLLIYIVLRDIGQGAKSVKNIIISHLGFHKEGTFMSQIGLKDQLLNILENVNENRKLVILMDGFDEISDKNENIEDVITGQTYQNIYCITTCRPHATHGIVLQVDVEIRLKGFSKAQAESFVKMYASVTYTEQDQIESFVKQTMHQIILSNDLSLMSTNPSMLQLLCRLLDWKNGKAGKDRTSIFKDYTRYLLVQYHIKLGKKEDLYSDNLYEQHLLDAGKVALVGLKQNQLQLVFSKREVLDIGGDEIFKIGFFTDPLSMDTESVKVQFTHKTLQEYLAALYVVNTPGDEGLQLLMEFCSTSQRLMGSQIILEFISNMSTDIMGKEIQKKIEEFVSKWNSDDKVHPRVRTSFLISMLEGTETLTFPLPAVIDIDFTESSFKKSALDRFFGMDGQGVRKISLTLDRKNRLNVLKNTTINSLDELKIFIHLVHLVAEPEEDDKHQALSYPRFTWPREDNEDLRILMKKTKPSLLQCEVRRMDQPTIDVILQHVHTFILDDDNTLLKEHLLSMLKPGHDLKDLKVKNSYLNIDGEVIEAVSKLKSDFKLDLIAGTHRRMGVSSITLIHKSATMKFLNIRGVEIDTEIAEAVSRLPDDIQLDLSGNCLKKIMDPRLVPGILIPMPERKKIDMTGWRITIDVHIVRALSKMPQLKSLKGSFNKLTPEAAREFSMSQLQYLELCKCGINDTVCVSLMISLSKHCPLLERLNLDGNFLTCDEWCHHFQMKQLRELNLSRCGIDNTLCVSLMISLSKHCLMLEILKLGNEMLQKNNNTLTSDVWCHHIQMKQLRELNLSNCYISYTVCASLMISLSKHCPLLEVLQLDGNNLTSDEWCPHIQMKKLRCLNVPYCGINDTVCVSLVISLSKHCHLLEILDLRCNNVLSSGVLKITEPIKHMKKMKFLCLFCNPCERDQKCMEGVKNYV